MADVLAIVGSTSFVAATGLQTAGTVITGVLQRRRPDRVVSGGADGVDTLGVQLAREQGIDVREHLPANRRWEPDGFRARNDKVADECTRLMRVACRWSRTYGSGYTHDRAKDQGKQCWSLLLPTNLIAGSATVQYGKVTVHLQVAHGVVVDGDDVGRRLGWVDRDADDLIRRLVRRTLPVVWRDENGETP